MSYIILVKKLRIKGQFGVVGIDWNTIFKWILKIGCKCGDWG
jgi:hypothetical protein